MYTLLHHTWLRPIPSHNNLSDQFNYINLYSNAIHHSVEQFSVVLGGVQLNHRLPPKIHILMIQLHEYFLWIDKYCCRHFLCVKGVTLVIWPLSLITCSLFKKASRWLTLYIILHTIICIHLIIIKDRWPWMVMNLDKAAFDSTNNKQHISFMNILPTRHRRNDIKNGKCHYQCINFYMHQLVI